MRTTTLAILLAFTAAATATAAPKTSPVKALMTKTVTPASNVVFAVGGEADPSNSPLSVPAKRWAEAAAAAAQLKAAGQRMQKPPLAKDQRQWARYAAQLATVSDRAQKAALGHNGARLSQAANDLGESCSACHAKYKPQT